jgi:hypothetical protein
MIALPDYYDGTVSSTSGTSGHQIISVSYNYGPTPKPAKSAATTVSGWRPRRTQSWSDAAAR